MRAVKVMIAGLVLAGCAQTPVQVRDGAGELVALKGDYKAAANCVLRQMEYSQGSTSNLLWRDSERAAEVISKGIYGETLWVVDIAERNGRTEAVYYISRQVIFSAAARDVLREKLNSC